MKNNSEDWDKFLTLFVETKNKETVEMLFQLFMTSNERVMLLDRYRLVHLLLTTDFPQRDIAEKLKLSISKITAGSKALQILPDEDREYLKKKMKPRNHP